MELEYGEIIERIIKHEEKNPDCDVDRYIYQICCLYDLPFEDVREDYHTYKESKQVEEDLTENADSFSASGGGLVEMLMIGLLASMVLIVFLNWLISILSW